MSTAGAGIEKKDDMMAKNDSSFDIFVPCDCAAMMTTK